MEQRLGLVFVRQIVTNLSKELEHSADFKRLRGAKRHKTLD